MGHTSTMRDDLALDTVTFEKNICISDEWLPERAVLFLTSSVLLAGVSAVRNRTNRAKYWTKQLTIPEFGSVFNPDQNGATISHPMAVDFLRSILPNQFNPFFPGRSFHECPCHDVTSVLLRGEHATFVR